MREITLLSLALLLFRIGSLFFVAQPGYTDAYYYVGVASRLAHGEGLTADFVWSWLEAPALAPLPIPSHRFWMPLASVVQAGGIALAGPLLGDFRAAQSAIVAVAAFVPFVTWRAARAAGLAGRGALVAAALAGLGGLLAPAWVTLDGFAAAAVLGTSFFLLYGRAAEGSPAHGVAAGLGVGALFLARAEGALFGLALLALVRSPSTRRAGVAGSAVALAIGLAWLARDVSLGGTDLVGRGALLTRYEAFFALSSFPSSATFAEVAASKADALARNAVTALSVSALAMLPLAIVGARAAWGSAAVRAWAALALCVYLVESFVWTLHSTRGSYAHSLAAFVPFGAALAVRGALALAPARSGLAAGVGVGLLGLVSVMALGQWREAYEEPLRLRAAAAATLPGGPLLAADAAAWRWIAGRPALVTPSDGLAAAACVVSAYGARAVVLELSPRFSQYDALYRGEGRPEWLGAPIEREGVKIFPVVAAPRCDR